MKKSWFYFLFFMMVVCLFFFNNSLSNKNSDIQNNEISNIDHNDVNDLKQMYSVYAISRPKKIDFAGEYVPLESDEIWQRLDRELHVNTYWQSNTMLLFKKANKYFPVIEPILEKNNVPNDFKYLALVESGLSNVVSPAGAAGFWQFLKGTARDYDLEVNSYVDERYHLEKSTQAACEYLNNSYSLFGSWTMAAAAYNMGNNRTKKQISKQQTNNYFNLHLNSETSRYVFRILAMKIIMQDPLAFGFHFGMNDLYSPIEYQTINIDHSINNLYDFAKDNEVNFKILINSNPWIKKTSLPNRKSKKYKIKIPLNKNSRILFNNHSLMLDTL